MQCRCATWMLRMLRRYQMGGKDGVQHGCFGCCVDIKWEAIMVCNMDTSDQKKANAHPRLKDRRRYEEANGKRSMQHERAKWSVQSGACKVECAKTTVTMYSDFNRNLRSISPNPRACPMDTRKIVPTIKGRHHTQKSSSIKEQLIPEPQAEKSSSSQSLKRRSASVCQLLHQFDFTL